MHYRNGREAKNGDRIVRLSFDGKILDAGVLCDAVAGNDYCNGHAAFVQNGNVACLVDCLHADDVAALIAAAGFDKRPAGK